MLPGTGESEKWEMTVNGHRVSFEGDESILELVVMVVQLCGYKNHRIVYFITLNVIVRDLYFNKNVIDIIF